MLQPLGLSTQFYIRVRVCIVQLSVFQPRVLPFPSEKDNVLGERDKKEERVLYTGSCTLKVPTPGPRPLEKSM